jgi:glycopeptide antibiotics resistance protein
MKVLTLIVSLLILVAVLIPGSNIPNVNLVGVDKIVHICMFSAWAVAIRFDFPNSKKWVVLLAGMMFSLITEIVQLFAEGRSFDFFDMLFDGIGLMIGLVVAGPIIKLIHQVFGPKP